MRFIELAMLASSLIVLGACAGDADRTNDTAATATGAPSASADAPVHGAPITGRMHDVRMLFDGARYHFDPADLTIRQGDGVRWILISGAPHNVEFLLSEIPAGADSVLAANMPRTDAPLTGPMLLGANEQYVVSFANVPTGTYGYICTPHQMMGMKGTITVE